jgi:carbonic anhydrase
MRQEWTPSKVVSGDEALERLRAGNQRFATNVRSVDSLLGQSARNALVPSQAPFAIVLSCSDSRAPAELVFDQGLGDLFVVRVAGNVLAPILVGSVEFAAETFGTPLVVVMGHSHCGVIALTIDRIVSGAGASSNVKEIVERIRGAIEGVVRPASSGPGAAREAILEQATRANVSNTVRQLKEASPLLAERVGDGRLRVVGAQYSLETGLVDFFDGARDG